MIYTTTSTTRCTNDPTPRSGLGLDLIFSITCMTSVVALVEDTRIGRHYLPSIPAERRVVGR